MTRHPRLMLAFLVLAVGVSVWWALKPLAPPGTVPPPRNPPALPVPKEAALPSLILVDDFEVGMTTGPLAERKNRLDAFQGTWARRPSYTVITHAADDRPGRKGSTLRIEYSKTGGWCGWYTLLNGIDISRHNALVFWVKGEKGGERFDVGLADEGMQDLQIDAAYAGPIMAFLPRGVTTEWQEVKVPLGPLRSEFNMSRMGSLVLWFRYEGSGAIRIDDVVFVYDPIVEQILKENLPRAIPDPKAPRSSWVWKYDPVDNPQVRKELFSFCKRAALRTLYLYLGEGSVSRQSSGAQQRLADFLREAHQQGLEVHALQGNPLWALEAYHHLVLEWVTGFLEFNRGRPLSERMDGIHLDIEPYLMSGWETGDRERLKKEFVELLAHLRKLVDAERVDEPFEVGLAIPVFYNREPGFEEVLLPYVDYVALMDYYDTGIDLIEHGRFHLDLANRFGKKVVVGVETQDLVRMGQGRRRNTFHEEGWEEMERQLAQVVEAFSSEPSFAGIAIHAYDSYRLLQRGRNVPTRERPLTIPRIKALKALQPVRIDADLTEWASVPWIPVTQRSQVLYGPGAWEGSKDLSFEFALQWEPESLLVALQVTDDLLSQEWKKADMWQGDHVEVWIDVDLEGDLNEAVNSSDDFQVGLSPGNLQDIPPEVHVWVPSVDPNSLKQVQIAAQRLPADLASGVPSGYTLEARLPVKFLFQTLGKRVVMEPIAQTPQIPRRIAPEIEALQNGVLSSRVFKKGFRLGLMVDVSDTDDPKQLQKCLMSTSPERQWGDPTTFNILELQ